MPGSGCHLGVPGGPFSREMISEQPWRESSVLGGEDNCKGISKGHLQRSKGGKGDGWVPEGPGQWWGTQPGHDRGWQFWRRPCSCPGPERASQLCCHCRIAGSAGRAKSRARGGAELGRNPKDARRPGQRAGRPVPRGARAKPPTLGSQVGPRPALPTHRALRSRSGTPWPRRSLCRGARRAASCVRALLRRPLRSPGRGRSH